jgi:hypothetical protein
MPTRLPKLSVILLLTPFAAALAGEVTNPQLGITFQLPAGWQHETAASPGRTGMSMKPIRESDPLTPSRCRVDRHDLPSSYSRYTQDQMNDAYASKPLSRDDFAARLSEMARMPVTVLETGRGKVGNSMAYWATSSASAPFEGRTLHLRSKVLLSQTPTHAWNVQCSVASIRAQETVNQSFRDASPLFEGFFSSISFSK